MAALLVSVAVLAVTVLSFSSILRNVGTAVGWYLRKSTQPRRTLLLEKVATEEREYEAKKSRNDETEDDEWEKVESVVTRTAANGGTPGKEWKGIVGFFHPFWYVHAPLEPCTKHKILIVRLQQRWWWR